jgi:hypothetical protein
MVPRAEIQPVAHLIQSQGIGRRLAFAQSLGGVECLKRLVEAPGADEDAEDPVVLRDAYQHGKDDNMDESLEELPVVHGADSRYESQYRGC